MDDPALLTDTNAMTSSSPTRATLSTLPVEMLDRILRLVDYSHLVNLRCVNKYICAVANKPFAIRSFSTRRHVVTEHSLKALLAISAHETSGAHIKKIILSPVRAFRAALESLDSDDSGNDIMELVVDDSFVESGKFSDLMQRVLSNLKQHSDSIVIGVHDGCCMACRDRYPVPAPKRQPYYGEKACSGAADLGTVCRASEIFALLVAEMHAASIDISGLDIEMVRHCNFDPKSKTLKAIDEFLRSRNSSIDLHLQSDYLEYKHLQKSLRFSRSSSLLYSNHNFDERFIVQRLADKSLSELYLQDLRIVRLAFLDVYFAQSLQTVALEDISLHLESFSSDLYSNMFERLSKLRDLRHCKLHKLEYTLPFDRTSTCVMRTQSGTFPSAFRNLLLVFPDGKSEFEIQGTAVSQQLKDLAAYTAAAERNKIQETDTNRGVFNHRVTGFGVLVLDEEDSFAYREARLLQAALRAASGHDAES
ncbi:hypothetical protein KCU77_g6464, partial [Aureobasidium melanogenum]